MFKKEKIDLIYRIICLLTFIFVILFVKSIITLVVLTIFFFFATYKEENFAYVILYLLCFTFFCVGYYTNNCSVLKLIMTISFVYYFLDIPNFNQIVDKGIDKIVDTTKKKKGKMIEEKDEVKEESYYRFANINQKKSTVRNITLPETFYITVHLVILLLSIVVG